ncbi:MAG: hypothetical protein ABSE46_15255 [Terracidiphilus sp.]|jgi:hypothetical protein
MKRAVAIVSLMLTFSAANSQITSRSKDIVVEQPIDLPELAQSPGQAMELHSLGNGQTYLYLEQQQFSRLVILDVTDPGHIKSVGSVRIEVPGIFDFSRSLGDSAVLVSFRGDKGAAVVDLRNPKVPTLILANSLQHADRVESIGDTGLLTNNAPRLDAVLLQRDYQVVDAADPRAPQLLLTVARVEKRLTNPDTGTTYLLGSDGLTVIRQPKVEQAYHLEQTYTN